MAVSRPNVVVYQEYSALTIVADTPEMEVLVVGPCYQILDYLDDKDSCETGEAYGTLNIRNADPQPVPVAVVFAAPPSIKPGATLQSESVRVFLDAARVKLCEGISGDSLGVYTGTTGNNKAVFEAYNADGGLDFFANEVAVGDILVVNTGATTEKISTIRAVYTTLIDPGTTYDFLDGNGTYGAVRVGDVITISADTATTGKRDGTYTVVKVRSNTVLEVVRDGSPLTVTHVTSDLAGKTFTLTIQNSNRDAIRTGYNQLTGVSMGNATCLWLMDDFTTDSSVDSLWRIERSVSDLELDTADLSFDGNEVTVASDISVDLSSTLTGKKVTYGPVYMEYTALRTDLQQPVSYNSTQEILADLGKYDSRNPLVVGAVVAKSNTSTSVKVYGLAEDSLIGYQTFLDNVSSVREIYAIVPLTTDTSILATIKNSCEQLSDPSYVLANGIRQKFRVCIGSVVKPILKTVSPVHGAATTAQIPAAGEATKLQMNIAILGSPVFSFLSAIPGDRVRISTDTGATYKYYKIAQVISATQLEIDPTGTGNETSVAASTVLDASTDLIGVVTSTGSVRVANVPGVDGLNKITVTCNTSEMPSLYLTLEDTTATFITDGVIPGDSIYMPTNPNANTWTTYDAFVVDSVDSQTRLTIVNNGRNTADTANELPHGIIRGTSTAVSQAHMYYKVVRTMTKDQQVDDMVAVATSFGSKRTLLCYPDSVVVTDLVDGSLPRDDSDTPEAAAAQPGYYLACAVGGQTAGQPSQQGFTNMGIAGITSISGTNGYFKEEQLTELSNGGVYVFVQDNPSSLPYSIHEVTTDVSTLEFGEYMVTKNFDFVALTFLDSMLPFIGKWNLLPTTLEYIDQGLTQVGDNLKGRVVAKIGAPLTDYEIVSVTESTISTDRAEAYINVDLPMTLNTIGLHLVA